MLQAHLDWSAMKYSEWEEQHACVKAVYDLESTHADCDKSKYECLKSPVAHADSLVDKLQCQSNELLRWM